MILSSLKIYNFKNIADFDEEFSPGINCFTGPNGVGKTNILDAIHYLSFTKSYFNTLDIKNIRHGEDFFAIHGQYISDDTSNKISCIQKQNQKKQFLINDKAYKRFSEHIGKFPLIMISPYDHDLINDGSDVRRRFADMVISQFQPEYLDTLVAYNKALLQRNNLLKQFDDSGHFDETMLSMWDEQLESRSDYIFNERNKFFTETTPIFQEYFDIISGSKEKVSLKYSSQLENAPIHDLLIQSRDKDRILRYTTAGIHKDDILLYINDLPVKNYGSQGQQKSYVAALKLAQFDYIRSHKNLKPILLLDDIFDKLDDMRVSNIIKLVSDERFGQVFITDTNADRISTLLSNTSKDGKHFRK